MKALTLPRQPTTFIGRDDEVAEILELLADPACRLLTLVGPGGIGKTRLAFQVASQVADRFADGLSLVHLQSIRSPEDLISALADAFDLSLTGHRKPQAQLLNHLQDKEMLLVLDNFEQLLGAVGVLMAILQDAPGVKLLVTSREVLNLQEEWRYPVRGMKMPSGDADDAPDAYDAVRLFVERARRVRPDLTFPSERADVIRICRLVEGMPLAIELAASWTRTLSCAAIAAEIQRNLDFLTTHLRNVPERHRSMRAVFAQTWSLLRQEERDVFKRLSIFRGGFRRRAAEQVAGASLSILSMLVDKSLLRWEPDGRYQIHELLRQYAEEKLAAAQAEIVDVQDRHAAFYTAFLHERFEDVSGSGQLKAAVEIEAELDNVRAAWRWAVEQGKAEDLRKAAYPLLLFCQFQSRYLEGTQICEAAIQSLRGASSQQSKLALVTLLVPLAWFYIRLGQLQKAEKVLEESCALYIDLGIPPVRGHATDPRLPLGILASIRGDYAAVAQFGEEARRISEAHDHPWNRQFAYYVLTRAALAQGRYETAQRYARQACAITEETDDRWFRAYCLNELGHVARALGNDGEARQHYQASYALRKAFDDVEGMALALNHLGEIALRQEEYTEARRLFRQSLSMYQAIDDRGGLATSLAGLGAVACACGDCATAQRYLERALRIVAEIQFYPLTFSILVRIGDLFLQTGRQQRGLALLAWVRDHPIGEQETKDRAQQLLARYEARVPSDLPPVVSQAEDAGDLDAITAALLRELASPASDPALTSSAQPEPGEPAKPELVEPLTDREQEVLQLIAEGLTNQQIAEELVIAVGTVKWYASQIYGKLNVQNRTQAAARASEMAPFA